MEQEAVQDTINHLFCECCACVEFNDGLPMQAWTKDETKVLDLRQAEAFARFLTLAKTSDGRYHTLWNDYKKAVRELRELTDMGTVTVKVLSGPCMFSENPKRPYSAILQNTYLKIEGLL